MANEYRETQTLQLSSYYLLRIGERRYSKILWKILFSQKWSVDTPKIILNICYMKKIVKLSVNVKFGFWFPMYFNRQSQL